MPLLWAALLALANPGALMLAGNSVALQYAYEAQVAGFLLFAPVLNLTPVKMRLTPRALKRSCVRRLAREQFFAQNLHRTTERAGVLLFVSVAERSVESLARLSDMPACRLHQHAGALLRSRPSGGVYGWLHRPIPRR